MQKQAPSVGRILTMVIFALSCFGLLLYLWLAFGGPTPLKPQGYRFNINFPSAGQLAQEADVRISGVSVGKVTKLDPATDGTTKATVQIDAKFAPMATNTRATLRQKTLLGETYVELTPGSPNGPDIPENGSLAPGRVEPAVQFDEILSTFDPKTRAAFETWIQTTAIAVGGRGRDFSNALGSLPPFVDNTDELVALLNSQEGAVRRVVRNTGTVFNALSTRRGQLSSLITNANAVFATTAARNSQLEATFRALPTFEQESAATLYRLDAFAKNTNPLVTQLQPVADELTPTLQELDRLAPVLLNVIDTLGPVITAGEDGLPATRSFLGDLPTLLGAFDKPLRQLTPVLHELSFYKPELVSFFANTAAATQAASPPVFGQKPVHFLRSTNPLSPESLSTYQQRLGSNRSSAYSYPNAFAPERLKAGLLGYETRGCSNFKPGIVNPNIPLPAKGSPPNAQTLYERLVTYTFLGDATGQSVNGAPCAQQPKFPNADGSLTTYPQITASTGPVARR